LVPNRKKPGLNQNQTSSSGSGSALTLNRTCSSVSGSENVKNMLNFYHIRQEFRFKPGLKPDQTGSSVSGSAKKVPNWTLATLNSSTDINYQYLLMYSLVQILFVTPPLLSA